MNVLPEAALVQVSVNRLFQRKWGRILLTSRWSQLVYDQCGTVFMGTCLYDRKEVNYLTNCPKKFHV